MQDAVWSWQTIFAGLMFAVTVLGLLGRLVFSASKMVTKLDFIEGKINTRFDSLEEKVRTRDATYDKRFTTLEESQKEVKDSLKEFRNEQARFRDNMVERMHHVEVAEERRLSLLSEGVKRMDTITIEPARRRRTQPMEE